MVVPLNLFTLSHIITSSLSDQDDIYYIYHRRNCFIGQVNNTLCFSGTLTHAVKTRLFQTLQQTVWLRIVVIGWE